MSNCENLNSNNDNNCDCNRPPNQTNVTLNESCGQSRAQNVQNCDNCLCNRNNILGQFGGNGGSANGNRGHYVGPQGGAGNCGPYGGGGGGPQGGGGGGPYGGGGGGPYGGGGGGKFGGGGGISNRNNATTNWWKRSSNNYINGGHNG